MPAIILPRLLLKGKTSSPLIVDPGSISDVLSFISAQFNIPKELFFKNHNTFSGGIALFCNGTMVLDPNYVLQENNVLEIVMAISGG